MGPHPAVAAIRYSVRMSLARIGGPATVLAACSGGSDSLALAAAVAFEAPRAGLRAGGVTVDHGLQPGSAGRARQVAACLAALGLSPVVSVPVTVAGREQRGSFHGPEAAARQARYAALDQAARDTGAWIMLGHTLDDQAETVLLGLARGAGARSLAGMAPQSGHYLRPLLGIRRSQTRAACTALGLEPWDDPHNCDPAFARVRVRQLMPALEAALGPGVAEALARTADLLRDDADVMDSAAAQAAADLGGPAAAQQPGWPVDALAALPPAIRHRLLRIAAIAAGSPAGTLAQRHVAAMDAMITDWRGQRWADLPGRVRCQRRYGRLLFTGAVRSEELGGRDGHGSRP